MKNRLTEAAPHAESEHVHRRLEIEPVLDLGLRDWRHDVLHLPRNASPLIQPEMIPAHDLHGFGHDPRKSMERRDGSVDAWKQQHATTSGRPLTNDLPRQRRLDLRKNLDATSAIHDAQVISDFIVETSPESRVNQIEETRSDSIIRSKHLRIDHFANAMDSARPRPLAEADDAGFRRYAESPRDTSCLEDAPRSRVRQTHSRASAKRETDHLTESLKTKLSTRSGLSHPRPNQFFKVRFSRILHRPEVSSFEVGDRDSQFSSAFRGEPITEPFIDPLEGGHRRKWRPTRRKQILKFIRRSRTLLSFSSRT